MKPKSVVYILSASTHEFRLCEEGCVIFIAREEVLVGDLDMGVWLDVGGELKTRNAMERRASQCQPLDAIHQNLAIAQGEFCCVFS